MPNWYLFLLDLEPSAVNLNQIIYNFVILSSSNRIIKEEEEACCQRRRRGFLSETSKGSTQLILVFLFASTSYHQKTGKKMEKSTVEVEAEKDPSQELSLVMELAKGHMNRVFLALHRRSKELYAVKVLRKPNLRQRALTEKDILSTLDHPFLPSLFTHFESHNYIFLATKYCSGGDMNVLRLRQPNQAFSVSATRFYAAEVVLALEYLHKEGIVYRDLKPENILVQDSGHIMLTDFDLSLRLKESEKLVSNSKLRIGECSSERSHSLVGTKEYMAPEILWSSGHAFPVDWWSLGIFLYEMVYGRTPFVGANRKETFYNILCKDPFFTGPFSSLQDLIEKLLVKEPSRRLGSGRGAEEVKTHHFFHGLRWEELEFVYRPPFLPSILPSNHCSISSPTSE